MKIARPLPIAVIALFGAFALAPAQAAPVTVTPAAQTLQLSESSADLVVEVGHRNFRKRSFHRGNRSFRRSHRARNFGHHRFSKRGFHGHKFANRSFRHRGSRSSGFHHRGFARHSFKRGGFHRF